MTNPIELCERLRAIGGSSWGDGGWRVRCEAADLIESQAKQIAELEAKAQQQALEYTSLFDQCSEALDRVKALEAKCALLAASLAQEEARNRAIEAAAIERCAKVAETVPLESFASPEYMRQTRHNRAQIVDAIRALLKTDEGKE